jgi:AcrR family transcriptional regulator
VLAQPGHQIGEGGRCRYVSHPARLTLVNRTRQLMLDNLSCVERPVGPPSSGRHSQILEVAARLFAERGFHGVSVGDIGRAVGISGPALYKHFESKDAVLAQMLVSISERLLDEGRARVEAASTPDDALGALVDWHVEFALAQPSLIVVQDRDWQSLPVRARERVRDLQLEYVDLWAAQLRLRHPGLALAEARAMAHAAFGLINSTPHSSRLPTAAMHTLLREMALRSLGQ